MFVKEKCLINEKISNLNEKYAYHEMHVVALSYRLSDFRGGLYPRHQD